jgi:hypothetical protein
MVIEEHLGYEPKLSWSRGSGCADLGNTVNVRLAMYVTKFEFPVNSCCWCAYGNTLSGHELSTVFLHN